MIDRAQHGRSVVEGRMATVWYGRVSSRIGSLPEGGIGAGRNQDVTWNRKRRWSTLVRVVTQTQMSTLEGSPIAALRIEERDCQGIEVVNRARGGTRLWRWIVSALVSAWREGGGKQTFSRLRLEGRGQQGVRGIEVV